MQISSRACIPEQGFSTAKRSLSILEKRPETTVRSEMSAKKTPIYRSLSYLSKLHILQFKSAKNFRHHPGTDVVIRHCLLRNNLVACFQRACPATNNPQNAQSQLNRASYTASYSCELGSNRQYNFLSRPPLSVKTMSHRFSSDIPNEVLKSYYASTSLIKPKFSELTPKRPPHRITSPPSIPNH